MIVPPCPTAPAHPCPRELAPWWQSKSALTDVHTVSTTCSAVVMIFMNRVLQMSVTPCSLLVQRHHASAPPSREAVHQQYKVVIWTQGGFFVKIGGATPYICPTPGPTTFSASSGPNMAHFGVKLSQNSQLLDLFMLLELLEARLMG